MDLKGRVLRAFLSNMLAEIADDSLDENKRFAAAVSFMYISLNSKNQGDDIEDGPAIRSRLIEEHGYRLVEDYTKAVAAAMASVDLTKTAKRLAEDMLAVRRTLDSPVEDVEKMQHLRETFFTEPKMVVLKGLASEDVSDIIRGCLSSR